jgi:hypothetical protein
MGTLSAADLVGRVVASKYKITRADALPGRGEGAGAVRCEARALDDVSASASGDVWLWIAPWVDQARFGGVAAVVHGWQHVNTARLIDWGDDRALGRFWAYEGQQGVWLGDLIAQSGPLPWRRALDLTAQVLRALWHAHEHQLTPPGMSADLIHVVPAPVGAHSMRDSVRVLGLGWGVARERGDDLSDVGALLGAMLAREEGAQGGGFDQAPRDIEVLLQRLCCADLGQRLVSARDALDLIDALIEGRPLHTLTAHEVLSTARNVEVALEVQGSIDKTFALDAERLAELSPQPSVRAPQPERGEGGGGSPNVLLGAAVMAAVTALGAALFFALRAP